MERDALVRLLDRCKDIAFALTPNGEIWSWNKAAQQLLGYSLAEALCQPFDKLVSAQGPLHRPLDREYCALALRHGGVPSFDLYVRTRTGQLVWLNVTVLVFEALRTTPPLIVHLAHDITPEKEREALTQGVFQAARQLLEHQQPHVKPHALPVHALSEREHKILEGFVQGHSAAEIARALKISVHTLRNHIHQINRKLGTHNRLEAVTHALQRHLISS